jgi:hypothetical protein
MVDTTFISSQPYALTFSSYFENCDYIENTWSFNVNVVCDSESTNVLTLVRTDSDQVSYSYTAGGEIRFSFSFSHYMCGEAQVILAIEDGTTQNTSGLYFDGINDANEIELVMDFTDVAT